MQINIFILTQCTPVRSIDLVAHDHSARHDWFRVSINDVLLQTVILKTILDPRCRKKVFQEDSVRRWR